MVHDLIGTVFGRLTVVEDLRSKGGTRIWLCKCECGNTTECRTAVLRNGHKTSCGCFHRERITEAARIKNTKHGKSSVPEYQSWVDIRKRCYSSSCDKFHRYGGRGITMCDRWRDSFESFFEDMGPMPNPSHTVDRIDGDGNYEPGNCRWATRKEQSNHRSSSRVIEANGKSMTLMQWSEFLGIHRNTLDNRLKAGKSPNDVFRK